MAHKIETNSKNIKPRINLNHNIDIPFTRYNLWKMVMNLQIKINQKYEIKWRYDPRPC